MRGGLRTRSSGLSSGGSGEGAPQRRSIDLSGDGVHKRAPWRLLLLQSCPLVVLWLFLCLLRLQCHNRLNCSVALACCCFGCRRI